MGNNYVDYIINSNSFFHPSYYNFLCFSLFLFLHQLVFFLFQFLFPSNDLKGFQSADAFAFSTQPMSYKNHR